MNRSAQDCGELPILPFLRLDIFRILIPLLYIHKSPMVIIMVKWVNFSLKICSFSLRNTKQRKKTAQSIIGGRDLLNRSARETAVSCQFFLFWHWMHCKHRILLYIHVSSMEMFYTRYCRICVIKRTRH